MLQGKACLTGKPTIETEQTALARSFAEQLRGDIEAALPVAPAADARPADAGLLGWLRRLWRRLTGRG